jgi:hydrophobe/amphiphile efflux-1 (HAE1) family protein
MTIVIAVIISGIVALTLTPALCNVFLRRHEPRPILPIRLFNAFFAKLTGGFNRGVRIMLRLAVLNLLVFGVLAGTGYWLSKKLPTGLVPNEDQGVLMVLTYLMPGASLDRTYNVQQNVTSTLLADPAITQVGTMSGIDLATFAFKSDAGIAFAHLEDWDKRTGPGESAQAIAHKYMMKFMQNKEAMIIPVSPPPIRGMSTTGGFELYVQDRTGGNIMAFNSVLQKLVAKANASPELTRIRSSFNASVPQYHIVVDEDKAKALGVNISDIYTTLASTFGSGYANDFNLFGHTYHVNAQLESQYRGSIEGYRNVFVRSASGALVPVSSLVHAKRVVGPSVIQRFNMFTAAQISGQAAPGYSSGDAMRAIQKIASEVLPKGYTIAWAGTSYQENKVAGKGNNAFVFALVFIFLILAALYESWMLPVTILMTVPFALLGASLAVWMRGLENDIYFQVGLVTLVGLTAKNAILIVEFAQHKLREGLDLYNATIEGARIRFRPIVMTSLAFIGGTLPLALSTGAGANSRHIIGTTVVGGMIMLTAVAIFFIPLFYYLIMRLRMRFIKDKGAENAEA